MTEARTILIVEDEPLIAMMLEDFLETLDLAAAGPCDSVADALSVVAAGGFDAAILDLNLRGGETSAPVADALAEAGIPFLFATGGSGDAIPDRHRDRPTLPKPFTIDGIDRALAAL